MAEIARRASVKEKERPRFYAWLRRASAGMIERSNKTTAPFEVALREFVGCSESLFEATDVENELKDPERLEKFRRTAIRLVRLLDRGAGNVNWVDSQLSEWETQADMHDGFIPSLRYRKEVQQLDRLFQSFWASMKNWSNLDSRIKEQLAIWQKEVDRQVYLANFPMNDDELHSLLLARLHRRIEAGGRDLKALLIGGRLCPNLSDVKGAETTLISIKWKMADGLSEAEAIDSQLEEYRARGNLATVAIPEPKPPTPKIVTAPVEQRPDETVDDKTIDRKLHNRIKDRIAASHSEDGDPRDASLMELLARRNADRENGLKAVPKLFDPQTRTHLAQVRRSITEKMGPDLSLDKAIDLVLDDLRDTVLLPNGNRPHD